MKSFPPGTRTSKSGSEKRPSSSPFLTTAGGLARCFCSSSCACRSASPPSPAAACAARGLLAPLETGPAAAFCPSGASAGACADGPPPL